MSWGRNPWELKFAVKDYPYLNRIDRETVGEQFHGSASFNHPPRAYRRGFVIRNAGARPGPGLCQHYNKSGTIRQPSSATESAHPLDKRALLVL